MTTDRKPTLVEFLIGATAITAIVAVLYWRDIKNSEFYMRNFDRQRLAEKQIKRAEFMEKFNDLERRECAIMLRAKAELIQVEIERSVLFGMSRDNAEKFVMDEFEVDRKLCVEHGIYAGKTIHKDARDDCERYPGIYGC